MLLAKSSDCPTTKAVNSRDTTLNKVLLFYAMTFPLIKCRLYVMVSSGQDHSIHTRTQYTLSSIKKTGPAPDYIIKCMTRFNVRKNRWKGLHLVKSFAVAFMQVARCLSLCKSPIAVHDESKMVRYGPRTQQPIEALLHPCHHHSYDDVNHLVWCWFRLECFTLQTKV